MKNGHHLLRFMFVILTSLIGWQLWQLTVVEQTRDALRNARFLNPQVSERIIQQRQHLRSLRPSAFIADVKQATQTELQLWEAQFDKGADDRQQRLRWQQKSEAEIKADIKDHRLDEAWLELHLHRTAPPITEAEARAWFSNNREKLRLPVRHHVSHLFLTRHDPKKPDRQHEIHSLHQRLLRGESWAALTSEHSEDERSRHRAGDLGWLSRHRMPADFMAAVEAQQPGQICPPIQTALGWHLILVTERQPSRLPYFEEVETEIKAHLHHAKRQAALKTLESS